MERCDWADPNDPLYIAYHDQEWGRPVKDDSTLFEFLILETFQAGLSWKTILHKRENFRKAFDGFDYRAIALYGEEKVEDLLLDEGIIRNRLKVRATISNAQAFINVRKEFGTFSNYCWSFVKGNTIDNRPMNTADVKPTSPESDALSKDLKKRGFKFVGSTVVYAFMQAIGMVNDHILSCHCRNQSK